MKLAIYSTKQYDKKYLQQVNEAFGFELEFFDFLLTEKTAKTAHGCEAVCIFVNDDGSRPVLEEPEKAWREIYRATLRRVQQRRSRRCKRAGYAGRTCASLFTGSRR